MGNLFVIILRYLVDLPMLDTELATHRAFLDQHYATGRFLASGPGTPRTGGVIIAKGNARAEIEKIVADDPFALKGFAEYQIYEFSPIKQHPALKAFLD